MAYNETPTLGAIMFGFKNHSFQVKLVKDTAAPAEPETPHLPSIPKEEILDLYDEVLKRTAVAVVAVIGAIAVARTGSDIIVHHATK
jgi:hypothetical protein